MAPAEKTIEDLPAIPMVARQVMAATADELSDMKKLCEILSADQAMVAKVLKIANSSLYGLSRRVHSLDRAVVAIGFNTVKQLAIAMAIHGAYEVFGQKEGALWEHSVGASVGAFLIAKHSGAKQPEAAFTGGLLHDVGKAVLNRQNPSGYAKVAEAVAGGRHASDAELDVFDSTHAVTGGRALKQWQFPDELVDAVRAHHTPARWEEPGPSQHLALSVALANMFCHMLGIGCARELLTREPPFQRALALSGITANDVVALLAKTRDTYLQERKVFEA